MAAKPKTAAKKGAAKAPAAYRPSLKMIEFTPATHANVIAATGAKKTGSMLRVPMDKLVIAPGFNLRVTDTPEYRVGIIALKTSMLMEGYYDSKPLSGVAAQIGGEDVIAIIDGHRRFEAAQLALAEDPENFPDNLPVVLKPASKNDLDLQISLLKENSSEPLSMLERAVLANRMLKNGMDEADVAERFQVTTRHVGDLKVLIGAPKAIRDLIKDNLISASEAIMQLKKDPTGEKLIEQGEKVRAKIAEKGKSGATRLTKTKIDDGVQDEAPAVRMTTYKANFQTTEGATFMYEDAEPFLRVIGDETWFKKGRKATERVATCNLSVEVKIRRPKIEGEEVTSEAEAEAEPEAEVEAAPRTAPRKAAGKKGAAAATPVDDGLGAEDDDDAFGGEAPNLRELGIAEPADAGL